MIEPGRRKRAEGLYGRLQQRLLQALEEADSRSRLYRRVPEELELRGLTPPELQLIQAYREQNLQWLRGWHAAAEELTLLDGLEEVSLSPGGPPLRRPPTGLRGGLCCALCDTRIPLRRGLRVPACPRCGSRLLRSLPLR